MQATDAVASLGLGKEDLIQLGVSCKRLLDAGRVALLQHQGFACELTVRQTCLRGVEWM